ncbi:MAG: DAK2 domain-containing protein [Clostridia bacterium]|nr:DAK2 domain-containing protein [Clostridia bacterium]
MYKNIDAITFRKMFVGGVQNLAANKATVDSLNVFPVPDGDTGTNMTMTVKTALKEVEALTDAALSMQSLTEAISRGSLRGARGNSGVITSQILKGFCDYVKDKDVLNAKDFAAGLREAARVAYSSVNKPKEGTILTVIRVIGEECGQFAGRGSTVDEFLEGVLSIGSGILAKTPEMLPVLKKAGVVDAGGQGLLYILSGWLKGLTGELVETKEAEEAQPQADVEFEGDLDELEEITFAYCTEFFVTNLYPNVTTADIDKLRDKLSKLGDSLICIGDLDLIKVHVHTNTPGLALQYAVKLGELDKVKIENMLMQNRAIRAKLEAERKPLGVVAVASGSGYGKMFKDMGVDYVITGGQTMNPSVDDFLSAIKRVNADSVLILPNNKNVILAAAQAQEMVEKTCVVLPTVNVQSGLACMAYYDPNLDINTNADAMRAAIEDYVCGTVTTAVRNTTMNGLKVKEGNYIGLSDKKLLVKGVDLKPTVVNLVGALGGEEKDVLSLYYGKDVSKEECDSMVEAIEEAYPELEVMPFEGGQPHYWYDLLLE